MYISNCVLLTNCYINVFFPIELFMQKRYRWADEDGPTISDLFWRKCADRTKDNLSKERTKALQNASNEFPGQGDLHMHKYNP